MSRYIGAGIKDRFDVRIQERYKKKKTKKDPKKHFFSKIPQDFELLKQVPESSHQTGHFGSRQYIGTLILS